MNQSTTVLVLASGIGKRFAPLVTDKTLIPLMGKPLLQHTFESLQKAGFTDVIVTTNQHNHDFVKNYQSNLKIKAVTQAQSLGMADAVITAKPFLKAQPLLIINATDFVDDKLFDLLSAKIESTQATAILVGKEQKEYFDGGYLQVDGERLVGIVEKPGADKKPSNLVNLVFHWFRQPQEFLQLLATSQSNQDDLYEQALSKFIQEKNVGFFSYTGWWQAVKYPHMLHPLTQLFLQHHLTAKIDPTAKIHSTAVIDGPVFIGKNVTLEAGAVIKGPSYLGENTVIGNHVLVRQSNVEKNCLIGFGSEVARSYIGPGCKLHHNFIGDSILESNVNPSFGTTLANWRFDDQTIKISYPNQEIDSHFDKFGAILADGVFCGVNCSLMPGTVIGAASKLYPQIKIKGYHPEQTCIKQSNF